MASSWTGSLAERNEYAAAHLHLKPVQAMKLQTDVASRTWCWLSCFMENQLFEVRCGWIHFCVQMQNPCMIAWFQKIQHLQTVGQWSRSDPFSRTFHLNAYGGFQRDSSSQMVWPKRTRNCERPCEIGVNIPGPRSKTIHPKLRPVLILWACGPWMNATDINLIRCAAFPFKTANWAIYALVVKTAVHFAPCTHGVLIFATTWSSSTLHMSE